MRLVQKIRATLATWACLGMLAGPLVAAEPQPVSSPRPQHSSIRDVALGTPPALRGEVRDAAGKPTPGVDVLLFGKANTLRRTRTDGMGRFVFPGIRGGSYRILTSAGSVACRAWTSDAAPPDAQSTVLIASNSGLARGQQPMNERLVFNPILMGTLIAAAIAIPIAIHNDDDLPPGS